MPKVSVIIPTHNRADLIHSTISSVLNQTFQDFEIIVVDDASKDNTPEVVSSFDDGRIKYIRNEINKGDAVARNVGVINSSYEYVAFLDDDDEWVPEKLEKQVNLMENSPQEVGCVHTGALSIDKVNKKELEIKASGKRGDLFDEMLMGNYIITSSLLSRKACFERVGLFDESIPYCSDYDMWIRISREFKFEYINQPLVKYHVHENKLSNNPGLVIKGIETLLKKYDQLFASNRKGLSQHYLALGVFYCYSGNVKRGREAFLRAIKLYPFGLKNYFNLCICLLGVNCFKKSKEIKQAIVAPLKRVKFNFDVGRGIDKLDKRKKVS